jgi:hypothetical protein
MELDQIELARELARLRQRRGARDPDLLKDLGPQIKLLVGFGEGDTASQVRGQLAELITFHLKEEGDLQLAALAALGLHEDAGHPTLEARTSWLAGRLFCDYRTARRRTDAAIKVFVERVAGGPLLKSKQRARPDDPERTDDWFVRLFRVVFVLDACSPEAIEHRVIEFTKDRVEQITYRFSLPRAEPGTADQHEIEADAIHGVRIVDCERPVPEHFRFTLALPRSFSTGEQHEYGFRTRVPAGQPMQPYYVYTPYRRCDRFELIVRFDPMSPPAMIWQLSEAVIPMIESSHPVGPELQVDRLGEVRVTFDNLKRGLGYGLRWRQNLGG